MNRRTLRHLIVILLTLATAGIVAAAKKAEPIKNNRFMSFPMVIGEWTGTEIPMGAYVYRGIETPYLFLREYRSAGRRDPVSLSIVWFDDTNIAFHTPEACLGGVSNEVKESGLAQVRLGGQDHTVGKVIVNLGGMDQMALYFFDVDGHVTTSQSDIRLTVLMKKLRLKRSSASFVRVMAPITTTEEKALHELAAFLQAVYPILPEYTYTDRILQK